MKNINFIGMGLGLSFLAATIAPSNVKAANLDYINYDNDEEIVITDEIDDYDYDKTYDYVYDYGTPYEKTYMKDIDPDNEFIGFYGNEDILEDCIISKKSLNKYVNENYDPEDDIFSDQETKDLVKDYMDYGFIVLDLEKTYEKVGNYLTDGDDHYFDNGVVILRDYDDEDFAHYICKCSYTDFRGFVYNLSDSWLVDPDDENRFNLYAEDDNGDEYEIGEITYDEEKEILNYSYY